MRRFDPFEPIVLFALAYGAMFVARPAALLIEGERIFWGLDVLPTLPRALLIANLGAVSFVVGYETRAGTALAPRLPAARDVNIRIAAIAALVVAWLGFAALLVFLPLSDPTRSLRVLFGGRGDELGVLLDSTSTYIWYGSLLLAPAALVLLALAVRSRTFGLCAAASAVIALALVRLVPVGGRIVLLPLLGGMFALVYLMRDRRPGVPMLAVVALLALLGSYLTLGVRDPNDDRTLQTAVEDLTHRPHAVFDPMLRSADAEMVLALSGALTVIPEPLSYRWGGATVGNLVVRPVPREVWPGKPLPPGEKVVATVWPELYPGLDPAFSPLLVFYWDFGLTGVALGMALFGIVARLLYEWFLLYRRALSAQLIFAVGTWFVVVGARNDPVDTIVFAMFVVAPTLGILAVASDGAAARPLAVSRRIPMLAGRAPAADRRR